MIIAFFGGIIYNERCQLFGGVFDLIWGGIIFFGGFYSLFRFGKIWCVYTAQIIIADREMSVYNGREIDENILYDNIRSYRYEEHKGAYSLQIKLWTGGSKSFNSGGQLLTTDEIALFIDMVRAFESAAGNYQPQQQQQGASAPILR